MIRLAFVSSALIAALIALVFFVRHAPESTGSSARQGTAHTPVEIGFDGYHLGNPGRDYLNGDFYCEILFDQDAELADTDILFNGLTFWWRKNTQSAFDPHAPSVAHIETFGTEYWPNTAEWVSDTELVVGGRSREDGSGILETWVFEPSGGRVSVREGVDPSTGKPVYEWTVPSRLAARPILVSPSSHPLSGIAAIKEMGGGKKAILAKSFNTGEIFEVAFDVPASINVPVCVVSNTPSGGQFHRVDLSGGGPISTSGFEHSSLGFTYSFSRDILDPATSMFLYDLDSDGAIDGVFKGDEQGPANPDDGTSVLSSW